MIITVRVFVENLTICISKLIPFLRRNVELECIWQVTCGPTNNALVSKEGFVITLIPKTEIILTFYISNTIHFVIITYSNYL